ncbi:MAG: RNA-dependent DNA polymerase [Alicycliphilus sp.]|jgi:RNA-directed DNA polymerase|nr:MAG: RNA-dependent DNA polymerase [Alicycliphilus sp.]
MLELPIHTDSTPKTEAAHLGAAHIADIQHLARQLFACAADAGNSEHKLAHFMALPDIVLGLARAIAQGTYQPQAFTVFAVTDPKLREIFAPAFADRLVHQWLIRHIEPWWDKRFIDDSYANRKGKGTHAAVKRLQHFMRQPGRRWYIKLDIQACFPSIDRRILLGLWQRAWPNLPYGTQTLQRLDQVATAILSQSPIDPPPVRSGNLALLKEIPLHKSLFQCSAGVGMPIGSLTSQFFANVYLNELDQFIKHQLKVSGYVRYVDDFVLLADDPQTLMKWKARVEQFLHEQLRLTLHPHKIVMQRCAQGMDFLGSIVYPHHTLTRQRTVRALRRRIAWFMYLLAPQEVGAVAPPERGEWDKWLALHSIRLANGDASPVLLRRMLSTLNSYYGLLGHANTYTLRKYIYHHYLGSLRRYFLPADLRYSHLRIRAHWLMQSDL